jgi:hypothetical protein
MFGNILDKVKDVVQDIAGDLTLNEFSKEFSLNCDQAKSFEILENSLGILGNIKVNDTQKGIMVVTLENLQIATVTINRATENTTMIPLHSK